MILYFFIKKVILKWWIMNKIELLSPAGSIEKAKWAFMYGADAVYIGGRDYSLRANATNFSLEEIKELCLYAHKLNKKVYVTVNIIFHDSDYKGIEDYLKELYKIKVDAIIVSEQYIIDLAKKIVPKLELHISTQTSTLNYEAINFLEKKGATRVVLGRELSEKEIKDIKEKTNIELEMFIHGAMCSSYSGRCVLSNYMTNRDSNRGGCSQICRWNFNLCDSAFKSVCDSPEFSMATKDLSMLINIPKLIDLNISSLKIEGRMRSIYYIASVVYIYRKVIDEIYNGNYKYNPYYEYLLRRCANRDSVPQFFNKFPNEEEQYYTDRQENSNQDFLGIIIGVEKDYITIEQRNFFKIGDIVTIFGPNTEEFDIKVNNITDINNNNLDAARHPQQIVKIPCNKKVNINDIMRVKV